MFLVWQSFAEPYFEMALETGAVTQYESGSFLIPGGGFEAGRLAPGLVRADLPGFLAGGSPLDAPSQAPLPAGLLSSSFLLRFSSSRFPLLPGSLCSAACVRQFPSGFSWL